MLFCSQFVFEYRKRKNNADPFVIVSPISHKHICRCRIVVLIANEPIWQRGARSTRRYSAWGPSSSYLLISRHHIIMIPLIVVSVVAKAVEWFEDYPTASSDVTNTHYLDFRTSGLFVWVPNNEQLEEEVAFGCQCTQNQNADVAG